VTVFELARGVESVTAPGKRKFLDEWLAALLSGPFDVLPFDTGAALAASEIEGSARRVGRPIDTRDLFILATARAAGMSVATRNGRYFRGRGVLVVDPFGGAELREE
jgi:predicted nucleic acid-binding protein